MKLYFRNNTQNNWKLLFSNPKNTLNFFLNFFVCLLFYFMAIHWVKNNATAAGSILFDPIQKHFHSIDFSIYINLLTYFASLITVLIIIQNPFHLHYIFQAFTAVFLVRMICIFLIPLSPAPDMIKLHDPIANFIANAVSYTHLHRHFSSILLPD